jgi:hypothetical protein
MKAMKEVNEDAVKKAKYFYQMCLNESDWLALALIV